jgi:hypothetical protein
MHEVRVPAIVAEFELQLQVYTSPASAKLVFWAIGSPYDLCHRLSVQRIVLVLLIWSGETQGLSV